MIAAPELIYKLPPLYHRHVWRLYIVTDGRDESIIARCDDCPAEMDKGQIESILNGERMLTDE